MDSKAETIQTYLRTDGVLEVTLNQPESGNRFDVPMLEALDEALRLTCGDAVKAVLLTHAGDAFCLGGNLGDARQQHAGTVQRFAGALKAVLLSIFRCRVPVIAAIEGDAFGGGVSIVEACDMAASSSSARFAIPEIMQGMPPVISFSGAHRVLPAKRLMELALLGEAMSAEEAQRVGLITEAVAPGQAASTCNGWIARFAEGNPAAIETIRMLRQRMDGGRYHLQLESAADALVGVMMHAATWEMLDEKEAKGEKRDDQAK